MKTIVAIEALLILLIRFQYGSYSFLVVEGFNVAEISSRPSTRIGMLERPQQSMMQSRETIPNPTFKRYPLSPRFQHERAHHQELGSKSNDSDEGIDKSDDSESITDEIEQGVATDQVITMKRDGWRDNLLSDFLFGANYVHSQYLSILWKYSIVKTFKLTVPIAIALWLNHSLYNSFFGILRSILTVSGAAARLLQLPLEFAQSILLSIWNISPEAFAATINFLPNTVAIPVVQLLLMVRSCVMVVVDACCENNAIRFLASMLAILVWRPSVEEWQYRSVLDKLLFGVPRWILGRGQEISPSTIATIRGFKQNVTARIGNFRNETPVKEASNMTRNTTVAEGNENEDAFTPFLPDESTRILLGSILFATTRLGWLSTDPADAVALSNSPYGFTIGFLQSIGSLVSNGAVQRDLRLFILLLAIHQTISTFFVAQHVFAGLYRRKGLVASMGAHVSWTVGKGTIPLRVAWKFWESTSARFSGSASSNESGGGGVVAGDSKTSVDASNLSESDHNEKAE